LLQWIRIGWLRLSKRIVKAKAICKHPVDESSCHRLAALECEYLVVGNVNERLFVPGHAALEKLCKPHWTANFVGPQPLGLLHRKFK
jgi:hypothetical protein